MVRVPGNEMLGPGSHGAKLTRCVTAQVYNAIGQAVAIAYRQTCRWCAV